MPGTEREALVAGLRGRVVRLEAEVGALRRMLEPAHRLPTRPFEALEVRVGDAPWLVPIAAIREVLPPMALTAIPDAPEWVPGGFSYAGRVVPVVELAARLFARPPRDRAEGFIVFVEVPAWVAVLVDGVGRIVQVEPSLLTAPPAGLGVSTLLLATATIDGQPASLLSLDHVAFTEDGDGAA